MVVAVLVLLPMLLAQKPAVESADAVLAKRRSSILGHAHSFSTRLQSLQGPRYRVLGLAQLGTVHCKADPQFARLMFETAHQHLLIAEGDARAQKPPKNLSSLRTGFQGRVVACDRSLASEFARQAPENSPQERGYAWQIAAAQQQLNEDPDSAAALLGQAVDTSPTGVSMTHLAGLIRQLRGKNDTAADALFLRAVEEIRRRPAVNLDDLMSLGLVLFSAPNSVGIDDAVTYRSVGGPGGASVIVLSVDRADLKPALARAYLDAVTDILARPLANERARAQTYALGQMLLPKVQTYLPERAALLQGVLLLLNVGLPPKITDPASYAPLSESVESTDERGVEQIENISDQATKDRLYVNHVRGHLLFRNKLEHAREIARRVKNASLRKTLLLELDFISAAQLLERKQPGPALEIAAQMAAGIERCLLRLSAASLTEDKKAAASYVIAALEDARAVDDDRRPYLILAATGVLLPLDLPAARDTFAQAVFALNGEPPPGLPRTASAKTERKSRLMPAGPGYFMTYVDETNEVSTIPLKVPGVKAYDFESVMLPLFAIDALGTEALVKTLVSDSLLYRALPVLAKAWLDTLPRERP